MKLSSKRRRGNRISDLLFFVEEFDYMLINRISSILYYFQDILSINNTLSVYDYILNRSYDRTDLPYLQSSSHFDSQL